MGLIFCSNSADKKSWHVVLSPLLVVLQKVTYLTQAVGKTTKSNDLQSKELKHHAFIYNMYNNYIQIDIVIHFDFNVGTVNYMAKLSI